jgi:hypothetical protein
LSCPTAPDALGAEGVAGTVVIGTEFEGNDAGEVPETFVAVTVNVAVAPDAIPGTTIGEDSPVAICPVLDVAVYDEAAGESAGSSKATDAAPLLNGRSVPTSVATTLIGAFGSKKSFAD